MIARDVICDAIRGHNLVRLYYYDAAPGDRIVEPYTLGLDKAHVLILNGWFRSGSSQSVEGPGFRDYLVEKICAFEVLDEHFGRAQAGYIPLAGKKFQSVLCDLSLR